MQKNKHSLNAQSSLLQTAWNFFKLGHISDAETIGQEVLQLDHKQAEAHHLLGAVALHYGKAKEAVDCMKLAVQFNSKNPEALSNFGLAYHEQGLLEEAIKQYRRAVQLAPQYINAHYNLHAAVLDYKNPADAIACLRQVLRVNSRDDDARFMLAVLLSYTGNQAEAEDVFGGDANSSPLYQARLDAWHYLKQKSQEVLPPIMGSGIQTFKYAFNQANPDGLVMEFGVRFGTSIRMLAELAKEVHGFDSFEGLPDEWHHEPKGSYTTKGVIPEVPESVSLHVGWFDDTLPKFLAEHNGPVRLVNVDCDIYSSTKSVLELLAPRMVIGSVIVFDEYIGNEHWREDEFKAFQEAVAKYGWQYEYLCFSFFTKQVAVRLTKV